MGGVLAQRVGRRTRNQEVVGSTPLGPSPSSIIWSLGGDAVQLEGNRIGLAHTGHALQTSLV